MVLLGQLCSHSRERIRPPTISHMQRIVARRALSLPREFFLWSDPEKLTAAPVVSLVLLDCVLRLAAYSLITMTASPHWRPTSWSNRSTTPQNFATLAIAH